MTDRDHFEAAYVAHMNTQTIHFKTGMRDYTVDEIKALRDGENYTVVGCQNGYLNGWWWGYKAARAPSDRATALEESASICQRLAVEALDSYTTEAGRTAAHGALICAMGEIRNLRAGSADAGHRDSVIEECALIVERHQETFTTMSGGEDERHLTARRHGNQMGLAYVNAIRALKSQQDAAIEAQRSGEGS